LSKSHDETAAEKTKCEEAETRLAKADEEKRVAVEAARAEEARKHADDTAKLAQVERDRLQAEVNNKAYQDYLQKRKARFALIFGAKGPPQAQK
jgi:hypothetical protein